MRSRYDTPASLLLCLTCLVGLVAASPRGPEAAELEQMLRDQAARRAQAAPPALAPPSSASPPTAPARRAARTGGKPPWVDGADPAYPASAYLCAAGEGPGRAEAAHVAYGNLAKTFEVRVKTASHDSMAYRQTTGDADHADHAEQALREDTHLSSEASLQGVSIQETWEAPGGRVHAWVCLDRQRAAAELRARMADADAKAAHWLDRASEAEHEKAARLRALVAALDAASEREAHATRLRWVEPDAALLAAAGPPRVDTTWVAGRLAQALRELRIGVWTRGVDDAACRAALLEAVIARGYHASAVRAGELPADFDLVVVATTELEHAGSTMVGSIPMQLARGVLQVEVRQGETVLAAYEVKQKAGSHDVADARRRVLRGLAGQISDGFGPKIDAAVRGSARQVDL